MGKKHLLFARGRVRERVRGREGEREGEKERMSESLEVGEAGVGARGIGEVTGGGVGVRGVALLDFYTALALKKRTCGISKKLLHAERFSAPHCIPLSFTHQSNSADSWSSAQAAAAAAAAGAAAVGGNEMDCESAELRRRTGRKGAGWKNRRICQRRRSRPIEPL